MIVVDYTFMQIILLCVDCTFIYATTSCAVPMLTHHVLGADTFFCTSLLVAN